MYKKISTIAFIFFIGTYLHSEPVGWDNTVTVIEKDASQPDIAFNRNNLFVVYQKDVMNNTEIFFIRSTNKGKTWADEKKITTAPGSSENPLILFANSQIYIFWTDFRDGNNEIYFTHSEGPYGKKFVKESRITVNDNDSINPAVATTGDKIILIWSDNAAGDYELFLKDYDLIKEKWGDTIQITKYSGDSFYPVLVSLMDEFYLVWQQRNGQYFKVMFSKSDDTTDWSKPVCISEGIKNAYAPDIMTFPEGLACAFQGEINYEIDIYLSSLNTFEYTWSTPMKISDDLNIERYPSLISGKKQLYLFWYDFKDGNNEIVYKTGSDDGLIWSKRINLTQSRGSSKNFKISYDFIFDNIYVIWEEGNNGKICIKKTDKYCPAPKIVNASHDENEWSIKNDVNIEWENQKDASGIKDMAYIIDHEPDTTPEYFLKEYPVKKVKFYNLKDGIWYFHLRARDNAENMSKTVHYQIMINSQMHAEKEKYHVVKAGDTLWDVSKKFYDKPAYYQIIADYNNISDPELIFPHQILKIPPEDFVEKNR